MPARKPENPTYLNFQAQLESLQSEKTATQKKREDLKRRLSELESRLESAPEVEREYLDLSRDRENSVARYREINSKLMEAQVGQELEAGRKSERFSLIDPPQLPEKPRSPNRPAIFAIGLILALSGGVGGVAVLESLDSSIRSIKDLTHVLNAPLLSVIPHIENPAERLAAGDRRRWIIGGIAAGIILVLAAIHFFWMPLEVVWFSLLRRIFPG
jgi:hypothetical protein